MKRTALLLLLCFMAGVGQAQVIYVNHAATGGNDGTSWTDAFVFLQDALAVVQTGDEVWAAEGVYRPDQGNAVDPTNREHSFVIPWGVRLRGGFSAVETEVEGRLGGETVLSGDLLDNDNDILDPSEPSRLDNAFQVVRVDSAGAGSLLDGLVIADGNAVGARDSGAGIHGVIGGRLDITNVVVRHNTATGLGGGVYLSGGGGGVVHAVGLRLEENHSAHHAGGFHARGVNLNLSDTVFIGNSAEEWGGGLYTLGLETGVELRRILFQSNSAGFGGGMVHRFGPLAIENTHFWGNHATVAGGLGLNDAFEVLIANVVLSGNHALDGAGALGFFENGVVDLVNVTTSSNTGGSGPQSLWSFHTTTSVRNSIVWPGAAGESARFEGDAEPSVGHSIFEGGLPLFAEDAGGNSALDPLFVDPMGFDGLAGTEDDMLGLVLGSPAIDSGSNASLPPDSLDLDEDLNLGEPLPVDIAGSYRVFDSVNQRIGGRVDMGAHEFSSPPVGLSKDDQDETARHTLGEVYAFPNPAGDSVTIRVLNGVVCPATVQLVDLLGRVFRTTHVAECGGQREFVFDTSSLPSGPYFSIVMSQNIRTFRPLLVLH